MKYGAAEGGKWKSTQNEIEGRNPDGTTYTRFMPTLPHLTGDSMVKLQEHFDKQHKEFIHDPLVLLPLYILDFLCIHPFLDGNDKMARLIAVLELYHQGYEVGRYISLEKLIEDTKEGVKRLALNP